jgi:hypothetical protein
MVSSAHRARCERRYFPVSRYAICVPREKDCFRVDRKQIGGKKLQREAVVASWSGSQFEPSPGW